ncbi:MAG: TIGR00730 family Rossman fold protein [Verrucomicrobia bacterium]|nr:TIGR00730 family Rossman fold protein [Verrucomicrobiota bacterium]
MRTVRNICVFCGASAGNRPAFAEVARTLGQAIAERGLGLVYGAGNVGLMGVLADATLAAGGKVAGVIPEKLVDRELAHEGLTDLHMVGTMHERKAKMHALSDAYIVLPGGIGTMEEFFEAVTWRQLGYHDKPVALLNVGGFYDGVDGFFATMERDGFLHSNHRDLFFMETDAARLLDRLAG